ncbi:MAG: NUDIX hydrolase [Pelagimonas sp.]|uniref:NUDIX hydrolase n=1 Tax=Pelagimonas sp. TaxID=2073170 RepID=UPI003D6ADECA
MTDSHKVCPLVLRHDGTQVLAFRHPLAGLQLVKGTIEPGEDPAQAAIRELREEAGVAASVAVSLGEDVTISSEQVWHLFVMQTVGLPDRWTHLCLDDGGHEFAFFWHDLDGPMEGFDGCYRRVMFKLKRAMP